MKTLVILLLCSALGSAAWAQKIVNKSIPYSAGQRIDLDLKFGENITIKGWDKNEVGINISVNINNNKLNDALLVDINNNTTQISVNTDFDQDLLKKAQCGDCLDSSSTSSWGNNRICSKIIYEIYLPRKAELKVETINADMEIFDFEGPLYAKNISGFIDISLSGAEKADVSMKSITGECYSNISIAMMEGASKNNNPVGVKIKGKMNGGGIPLVLETISSNIYLRKKLKG